MKPFDKKSPDSKGDSSSPRLPLTPSPHQPTEGRQPEAARDILASGASDFGISLDEAQLDAFDTFTALLLEWNARFNLTRITDPCEIAVKHYLDSLSLLAVVDLPSGSNLIDVGTGAGFPSIPLKLVLPDLKITMLDSVRKRLTFLEAVVEKLNLRDMETLHARAEDAGQDPRYRGKYDLAVSRAVAKLNVLAELCLPFCQVGGRFAAYKSADVNEEVQHAEPAIKNLGGEIEGIHQLTLPNSNITRALVIVSKIKSTPKPYPRKAGTPERHPLCDQ